MVNVNNFGIKNIVYLFTALVFVISIPIQVSSQWVDDPNYDRIPWEYAKIHTQHDNVTVIPITVNGYDNFFLGTDFAESHISENPRKPGEYFVAFNINGTHYTLNGYDWFSNNPSFSSTMRGDPVTAHDSLGNLYYENMYGSPSILGTKIIKSTNNSVTWLPDVFGNTGFDKNWLAADQTAGPFANYVYTVMTASGGGNFKRSTDGGATFNQTFTAATQSLPGMMVCVGANGSTQGGAVYVVTNSGSSFAATYTFYRSTNGGATFTLMSSQNFANYVGTNVGGRNSVSNMRTRPYPFIAADNSYGPNRGRLYVVYASNQPAGNGNKSDIFCRFSTNGGTTWSSEVKINDDANTQNHQQWHPAIWCDKETGRLYVQWMDTRDTPTSDSAMIYASYSDNGGTSFVQNHQISNEKMKIDCPTCGGGGTPRYQGDYNAVVSNRKTSMIVWTDFRDGSFDSYVSYFPDFSLAVSPALDTVASGGSVDYSVTVPSVKAYSDSVVVSAVITNPPGSGTLGITFPNGNVITTFPSPSTVMRISSSGGVPEGVYNIVVTGMGPNGTPVHKRNVSVYASPGGGGMSDLPFCDSLNNLNNWTITNDGGTCVWVLDDPPYAGDYQLPPSSSGGVMVANAAQCGSGTSTLTTTTLTTSLDCTGEDTVSLVFDNDWRHYQPNDTARVQVSYDGGTTWQTIAQWGGVSMRNRKLGYYLPGAANVTELKVRFVSIQPQWDWFWAIDNVCVVGDFVTNIVSYNGTSIPERHELSQNYPNPFNPSTKIKFAIPTKENVSISVYDVAGREIKNLLNDNIEPGSYELLFDGAGLPSGVYFYTLKTESFSQTKRMILVK